MFFPNNKGYLVRSYYNLEMNLDPSSLDFG